MAINSIVRKGHPVIFGFILVFSIIELSISAWLTARFNSRHNFSRLAERDRVRYVLFCSCWTVFFASLYMILFLIAPMGAIVSIASHMIFLVITWILWVAAAAAVTALLAGGLNCKHPTGFVYCGQLNALEGFAWLIWIFLTIALVMVIARGISAAKNGEGYSSALVAED